jgi:hypothetical protein
MKKSGFFSRLVKMHRKNPSRFHAGMFAAVALIASCAFVYTQVTYGQGPGPGPGPAPPPGAGPGPGPLSDEITVDPAAPPPSFAPLPGFRSSISDPDATGTAMIDSLVNLQGTGGPVSSVFFRIDGGSPISATLAGSSGPTLLFYNAFVDTTALSEGHHDIIASLIVGVTETDSGHTDFYVDNHHITITAPTKQILPVPPTVNGKINVTGGAGFIGGTTNKFRATVGGSQPDSLEFVLTDNITGRCPPFADSSDQTPCSQIPYHYPATYIASAGDWEANVDATKFTSGAHLMGVVAVATFGSNQDISTGGGYDLFAIIVNSSLFQPNAPPPTITLINPKANDKLSGTVIMKASVDPAPKTVNFVVLAELGTYDHSFPAAADGSGNYTATLETAKLLPGPYSIKVQTDSGISGGALSPATHVQVVSTVATTTTVTTTSTAPETPVSAATPYEHLLVKLKCHGFAVAADDPCKAVYYVNGGQRHAFPNEKVYFSWYSDFNYITELDSLSFIPFGLNVVYRPGSRLVKFTTVDRVYVVTKKGVLRWITSEDAAIQLFGANWHTQVDDINDAFFNNYTFGADIHAASDYDAALDKGVTLDQNF